MISFYTDNSVTGIERIVAQCPNNEIIELHNYYPYTKWEIVIHKNYQSVCLDKGDGTIDVQNFASWLDHNGYTAKNNVRSKSMKISGLKKIAGDTKSLQGGYSGRYLQLNYNKKDHYAWTDEHVAFNLGSRSVYEYNDIVYCGLLRTPKTMIELAEIIERAVAESNV